jgi:hypothetical protein
MRKDIELSTSQLARVLNTYEGKVRQMDRLGILTPRRDIFGRRIFDADDVRRGREYLEARRRLR